MLILFFAGIGYGHFVIKMFDFSFIIIQTWTLLYLVFSFRAQLPWVTCNNIWNTGSERQINMHSILICYFFFFGCLSPTTWNCTSPGKLSQWVAPSLMLCERDIPIAIFDSVVFILCIFFFFNYVFCGVRLCSECSFIMCFCILLLLLTLWIFPLRDQ